MIFFFLGSFFFFFLEGVGLGEKVSWSGMEIMWEE